MSIPLLEIEELEVRILPRGKRTPIYPVRHVNLSIREGSTLALVGESGSGKSMTCLAIAGLLPHRAEITGGTIALQGYQFTDPPNRATRNARRKTLSMVFQDATNSLNPVHTIGWQIAEAVRLRSGCHWSEARSEAKRLLGLVGMHDSDMALRAYPHQFSGGMNQRAMVALAMAGNPKLLIADEATTALDVTIQAQILNLLSSLQEQLGMGLLLVTHDLGIVAEMADSVAVMYAGRIVEHGPTQQVFSRPGHPYTESLLATLPRIDVINDRLPVIPGVVPAIDSMPRGCAFEPRCHRRLPVCLSESPPLTVADSSRVISCFNRIAA